MKPTFETKKSFALGVGTLALVAAILGHLSSTQSAIAQGDGASRTRNIRLEQPENLPTNFFGADIFGQVLIQELNGGTWFHLQVRKLHYNCRQVFGPIQNQFFALYVETPSIGRLRVFNFGTDCNFGDFDSASIVVPPNTPTGPLFDEPITLEVVVEADDGLDQNVFPYAPYVLRGQD